MDGSLLKEVRWRSKSFRELLRSIPCQECGDSREGYVAHSHSNWQELGGRGSHLKASDSFGASLCSLKCHYAIDYGTRMSKAEKIAMWTKAMIKTYWTLINLGKLVGDEDVINEIDWEGERIELCNRLANNLENGRLCIA